MDKKVLPSLLVNDGSFMERFKDLQQKDEKGKDVTMSEHKPSKVIAVTTNNKTNIDSMAGDKRTSTPVALGGKLAFSLKNKSKLVAPPVNIGADDDDDDYDDEYESDGGNTYGGGHVKRQKLEPLNIYEQKPRQFYGVPPSPSDDTVKKVADKLAYFVAKHGREFQLITRQRNPGDTPFKFLFDEGCSDYKYYENQLAEEQLALSQNGESHTAQSGGTSTSASKFVNGPQRSVQASSNYQTPASALYGPTEDGRSENGESGGPSGTDPIAMMEFYMKKAAREDRMRQPKQSKDEMPPPAFLQAKRGHHMGDYIPQEELEKFLSSCSDASGRKLYTEAAEKAKIQADNVGHKLLSKMGWKEGEGLGSSKHGIADPITAGDVKKDNLGVGAHQPGEVLPDDDIYEQYKKRMMLGYRHRPNPLNNPRKAYY